MKIITTSILKKTIYPITLASLFFSHTTLAVPSQIFVTNDTPIALSTKIAGLPGNGIPSNISKPVPYNIVSLACNFSGSPQNCPIEFRNKLTGELVSTIRINALTAALIEPPTFHGEFADKLQVVGWDTVPIEHIKITAR